MTAARRALRHMRDLERLQRIERDVAAIDVAEAQDRADAAAEEAARTASRAGALATAWQQMMSAGGGRRFVPEMTSAIGAALRAADAEAATSARHAEDMASVREARSSHWHRLDATLRATGKVVGGIARDITRDDEEAALASLAERVTLDWRRR